MPSTRRTCIVGLAFALVVGLLSLPAFADPSVGKRENYLAELAEIDAALLAGKWKSSLKQAQRLADTIVKHSWTTRNLAEILAEVAFQEAVALANLGEREEAVWYWYTAQNLDFRIRKQDFEAYGPGGKLLREFPLRDRGEVPAGFVTRPHTGDGTRGPKIPKIKEAKILTNTGALLHRRLGDFNVELVLDETGRIHHPVVISDQQNPIVLYFVLESLLDLPPFEPALYLGEPVDCLFDLSMPFRLIRW